MFKVRNLASALGGLTLAITANSAWAACNIHGSSGTLTITVPKTLIIPKNTPVGTVLYSSAKTRTTDSPAFTCISGGSFQFTNGRGDTATGSKPSPLGDTGIGVRLNMNDGFTPNPGILSPNVRYSFAQSNIGITLYKTGEIKGSTLDTGKLGALTVDRDEVVVISLSNAVNFTESSCQTPSINVDLGKQYTSKFGGIGTTIGKKAFSIALNDCPAGLSGISYQLDPVNPAFDAKQGILALDEGGASGVGIQITDQNNAVVTLGEAHRFLKTEPTGNYAIALQAAYYKTADQIEPGKANASMQFTITYQ